MKKPPPDILAAIITFGEILLAFLPAGYFATTLFFACVPYVYYGFPRAWSESISAEPLGKAWIKFSTGEVVTYGVNLQTMVLSILMAVLFLTLVACLFTPVLQATQFFLARIAPNVAKVMADLGGPDFQRDASKQQVPDRNAP